MLVLGIELKRDAFVLNCANPLLGDYWVGLLGFPKMDVVADTSNRLLLGRGSCSAGLGC